VRLIEKAVRLDTEHPAALANLGVALRLEGRLDESLQAFNRALALQPGAPETHYNRALTLLAARREAEALAGFERTVALAPQHAQAHMSRGVALERLGRDADAIGAYDAALAIWPDHPRALYDRGHARHALGDVSGAEADYRRAQLRDPEFAEAHVALAESLLLTGRVAEGWREFAWRWRSADLMPHRRSFTVPQWRGEPISGKTILVHAEQGFGDTIQFCRFVRDVAARGARVVFEVQPQLVGLLQGVEGATRVVPLGAEPPGFDVQALLLDLPGILQADPARLPPRNAYIAADPARIEAWSQRLGPRNGLRVGLAWSGHSVHRYNERRSTTPAALAPLFDVPGVAFIALQPDAVVSPALQERYPRLRVPGKDILDFADTAAVIAGLDLVISIDTVFAHLGGALGVPTWVMLASMPDWRWQLGRTDSPWYPSARLFRQNAPGAWDAVIAQVRDQLAALASEKT
jgi:Flp pilus assembly protein TadD